MLCKSHKRTNYISLDEYFMGIALLSARRSKDPNCQVGACIVNNDKKIVGVGYNTMPQGCSDVKFPWTQNVSAYGIKKKSVYGNNRYQPFVPFLSE
jgi:deoxycytidylate deaminase